MGTGPNNHQCNHNNTKKAKAALLSKLQGNNGLAQSFCVFPFSDKLVDELHHGMNPFMRPYETENGKFLISLDVCLSHSCRACDTVGIESFVLVTPSDNCIKTEFFTRQMTPVKQSTDKFKWFCVDRSEEIFHNCITKDSIRVKGSMFDLSVPLDIYLACVKDLDDFIEIRQKRFEEEFQMSEQRRMFCREKLKSDFLRYNTDPAWGMSWFYGKARLIGAYMTIYWKRLGRKYERLF